MKWVKWSLLIMGLAIASAPFAALANLEIYSGLAFMVGMIASWIFGIGSVLRRAARIKR